RTTQDGDEFVIIDPARGTRSAAVDSAKIASALSSASGTSLDARPFPLTDLDFSSGRSVASFKVGDRNWQCDLQSLKCTAEARSPTPQTSTPGPRLWRLCT